MKDLLERITWSIAKGEPLPDIPSPVMGGIDDSGFWTYCGTPRRDYCAGIGWCIPSESLVELCRENAPLVDIGAGSGWLTALLNARGIDCIATDPCAGEKYGVAHKWAESEVIDGPAAVLKYPTRTLLWSWPCYYPTFSDGDYKRKAEVECGWQQRIVRNMQPGQRLILIAEAEGGCNGSDYLWRALGRKCKELEHGAVIPQWEGIHDKVWLYEKHDPDKENEKK